MDILELEESLKLLSDFILNKIKNSEIVDISSYDSSITIIRDVIINHNNKIEEIEWKDEKYHNDINNFMERLNLYQKSIKIYENEEISGIISVILSKRGTKELSEIKEDIREELIERGYNNEKINAWIDYLE